MDDWMYDLLFLQRCIRRHRLSYDPFERLAQEHRIIYDLASTLEVWALRVDDGHELSPQHLGLLASFLVEFVEEVHHAKEESVLIPNLLKAGLLHTGEGQLELDHHDERYLVDELRRLAAAPETRSATRSRHFATLARELVAFQRRHLREESEGAYALIRNLSPQQRAALRADLTAFDQRTEAVLSKWRITLRWLLDRRGVSTSESAREIANHLHPV